MKQPEPPGMYVHSLITSITRTARLDSGARIPVGRTASVLYVSVKPLPGSSGIASQTATPLHAHTLKESASDAAAYYQPSGVAPVRGFSGECGRVTSSSDAESARMSSSVVTTI